MVSVYYVVGTTVVYMMMVGCVRVIHHITQPTTKQHILTIDRFTFYTTGPPCIITYIFDSLRYVLIIAPSHSIYLLELIRRID